MIEKQMTSDGEETKKLYYEDSHLKEFTATVLSCEERLTAKGKKDGYAVVLDQTAFFPEGGGQGADHGTLGGAQVLQGRGIEVDGIGAVNGDVLSGEGLKVVIKDFGVGPLLVGGEEKDLLDDL